VYRGMEEKRGVGMVGTKPHIEIPS
jgi:hypothetical protein